MKKSLGVAVAAAFLATAGAAQAEQSYVKVAAGQGQYTINGQGETETALSLAFGQSLSENWGYEVGYINFGNHSYSLGTATSGVRSSLSTQSLYAAAVGTLPLGESFSLFAKLGLSANYSELKASGFNSGPPAATVRYKKSDTSFEPMAGVGAAFNISKQVAVTAEYQYFGKVTSGLKVDAWTLGLKYGF